MNKLHYKINGKKKKLTSNKETFYTQYNQMLLLLSIFPNAKRKKRHGRIIVEY